VCTGVGGSGGEELTVMAANRSSRASNLAVREACMVSILVFKVELSWERVLTASSSLSVVTCRVWWCSGMAEGNEAGRTS